MSNEKLRAGIIGCGLGAYHGYAYMNAPEFELIAICDLNTKVLDDFFKLSRIPRGSVREYNDYHAMLDKEKLDVVSVATPDDYHANPVCDASDAGIKGIFCEKPLAINLKDADRIIETVEQNGTKMSVDHTRSWLPVYQAVRTAVREGEIGGLTRIVAHMGGRRSMLFRNGPHLIDAICYFADAAPVWLIGAHEQGFEDYGIEYKGENGSDPTLDPASSMFIEFANGVRGIVNSAKMTPAGCEFDLQGPNGRYVLNDNGSTGTPRRNLSHCKAWRTDRPEGTATQVLEVPVPQGETDEDFFGDILIQPIRELAQMVWNDVPSSSPPRRARHTLEIMLGALYSQSRNSAKIHLPLPRNYGEF